MAGLIALGTLIGVIAWGEFVARRRVAELGDQQAKDARTLTDELNALRAKQEGAGTQLTGLSDHLRQLSEKGIIGEPQKMDPYQQNKAESDGIVMAVTSGAPKSFELALTITSPENATVLTRATRGAIEEAATRLYAGVTGVVRKGSVWVVNTYDTDRNPVREPENVTVWFVPISIPRPPANEAGKK
jgi:hypothetical protein